MHSRNRYGSESILYGITGGSPQEILEPTMDRGDWQLEVERVLPQLRVAIRTEAKDWRSHLEQMNHHRGDIDTRFKDSRGHLQRLHEDLSRGLDKIGSREKYINSQVDRLLTEYRCSQVSDLCVSSTTVEKLPHMISFICN